MPEPTPSAEALAIVDAIGSPSWTAEQREKLARELDAFAATERRRRDEFERRADDNSKAWAIAIQRAERAEAERVELAAWRDAAVASCAKRQCETRDRRLREAEAERDARPTVEELAELREQLDVAKANAHIQIQAADGNETVLEAELERVEAEHRAVVEERDRLRAVAEDLIAYGMPAHVEAGLRAALAPAGGGEG